MWLYRGPLDCMQFREGIGPICSINHTVKVGTRVTILAELASSNTSSFSGS